MSKIFQSLLVVAAPIEWLLARLIGQRMLAVAKLTWQAAFRSRLFLSLSGLLLGLVLLLPVLVKDDGTAQGFTQIVLTYTLSATTVLLGACTLWLACGVLARDIEECQMQMVAVKPIPRWQIWLGKWIGIVLLNALLLLQAGICIYGLIWWRVGRLPQDQQAQLRKEVLVARGSLKEPLPDIQAEARSILAEQLKNRPVAGLDVNFMRRQIEEGVRAQYQLVPAGHMRRWDIPVGSLRFVLRDKPMSLRLRFHAAQTNSAAEYFGQLRAGPPDTARERVMPVKLAADAFHEFELPPNMWDDDGNLIIHFINAPENGSALLVPLENGLEVLYREGGFGLNFSRGLGIIFCWLALLSALGLATASLMSFPVASFVSFALLFTVLSSGIIQTAVEEQSILGYNEETGAYRQTAFDVVLLPAFTAMLKIIGPIQSYSPVDSLSSGRTITWSQLGMAWVQIIGILGGLIGLLGILFFSRRELAAVQSNT